MYPSKLLYFIFAVVVSAIAVSCGNGNDQAEQETTAPLDTTAAGLAALNKKILDDPSNPSLYHQRAQYYFMKSKDVQAALADMGRVLKLDSTKAEYFLTLSDLYFAVNKTGNAKAALEKCIQVDPKNTEAMLKLAELHLFVKKHQESIDFINMALKVDQYNAKAYFMKGMNFKEIGDTARAISSMETAVEQDPEYYAAFMQLGVLHSVKKNPIALNYFDNALRLNPGSTEAVYGKAKFYQDTENWNAAIQTYTNLLQIDPNHKFSHFNLGVVHLQLEVRDKALQYFDTAIKIDPRYKEAYYGRGFTYEVMGDVKKAESDYRTALQIDPQYEAAAKALGGLMMLK